MCQALCRSGVVLCARNIVYLKPQEVAETIMRARTPPLAHIKFFALLRFSCAGAISLLPCKAPGMQTYRKALCPA